jgi:hypothetical protein
MNGGMGWFFVGTLRFSGWFLCDKIFGLEDFLNYLWPGKIVWYLLDDFCLNVSLDLLLAMVLQIITIIYVVVAKKNKTVRNHGSFMLIQSFDDHRVWMIPIFSGFSTMYLAQNHKHSWGFTVPGFWIPGSHHQLSFNVAKQSIRCSRFSRERLSAGFFQ